MQFVIPVKTGIHNDKNWIPAYAGMTLSQLYMAHLIMAVGISNSVISYQELSLVIVTWCLELFLLHSTSYILHSEFCLPRRSPYMDEGGCS